jgi:LmbE family N-acetylglucosaminyl deacetylase
VTKLDAILDQRCYDEVYIPCDSYNQDHEKVHKAAFAALRATSDRKEPALIAQYEYAFHEWAITNIAGGKLYLDISNYLETKIEALESYKSQIRPFPHPCSSQAIHTRAFMRGMECGGTAAELFYLLRMVA